MQYLRYIKERRFYLTALYIFLLFLYWSMSPPRAFPAGKYVTIQEGMSVEQISRVLEEANVIRAPFWFRVFAIALGGEHRMKAGDYYFDRPESASLVAWRIEMGDHQVKNIRVTVPEGFTIMDISERFDDQFIFFNNKVFEADAMEGYLFPDTYFVPITATATSTLKLFRDNFDEKVAPLLPEIKSQGKTLHQIVVMASLIEGEAKDPNDMTMISGILWKRMKIGMPLQVDSARGTYEFKGLPDNAINNPGINALRAAVHPDPSPYLYYITGNDKKMHYARTFEEHKQNIAKYLR